MKTTKNKLSSPTILSGTLIALFVFIGCQKDVPNINKPTDSNNGDFKHLFVNGVPPITEEDLAPYPILTIEDYQRKYGAPEKALPSSVSLPTPPVGNQGSDGACVGWGTGYAAHSILRYMNNTVHQGQWGGARRSPSYVYNQIKLGSCSAGSYPWDALNLLVTKGECSELQMSYANGQCYTLPSSQQHVYASQRKVAAWYRINEHSTNDIKYYLSQNLPVPVCYDVNSSFFNIYQTNYVWNSLYGYRQGGHCVCIVGYNDATQRFKVMNSWGSGWGIGGYFYISYNNINNGCLNFAAIEMPNPSANTPQ